MRNIYITILCSFLALLAACSKDNHSMPAPLPDGSVSFNLAAGKDTIEMPLSILSDSAIVIGFKAALSGKASDADHWVNFSVDTTRIADFRALYGDAMLLPKTSWLFYKGMTRIPAGQTLSDSAQINIGLQTKLMEYSTYVLPIVIQSVDGSTEGAAAERTVFLVFKTGKPLVISRLGWTIEAFSSSFSSFHATNLIDNQDLTTYWANDITQTMPQSVTINFNRTIIFSGVNYFLPNLLVYPTHGGYPTSIKIETSEDGADWTEQGIYAGNIDIATRMQTLPTGLITARYLRFTVLECVKYVNVYEAVFIGGISLMP